MMAGLAVLGVLAMQENGAPVCVPTSRGRRVFGWLARVGKGCILVAATGLLLTVLPTGVWYLDNFAYGLPLYLALGAGGTALCVWRSRWWAAFGIGCAFAAAGLMAPCYIPPGHAGTGRHEPNLRILQANVFEHHGSPEALIRLVQAVAPDVVLLQEASGAWESRLDALNADYPRRAFVPRYEGGLPDLGHFWRGEAETPRGLHGEGVPATETVLHVAGRAVRLLNVHLASPHSPERARRHEAQMRALTAYACGADSPFIVTGDLNTSLWSRLYKRLIAGTRLVNSRQGFGVLGTWPSFLGPLRTPLDNTLVSPDIEVVRTWVGPSIGSDHRPLVTDLYVPSAEASAE
jgi:endonuclease/exonuclease/phosphatase (EEP) superfamily protein YafD